MAGPYTLTARVAQSTIQPKGHHVGVHAITSTFSLDQLGDGSASFLASATGNVFQMVKIAPRAKVLAIYANFAASAAGAQGALNIGLGTSLSCFGSLSAKAGGTMLTKGFPKECTMSDDAVPRWRTVNIYVPGAASLSGGGTLTLTVFLTNDVG